MNEVMTVGGIGYCKPKVTCLVYTGIGVSEIAARTCYNSFDKSENEDIRDFSSDNVTDFNSVTDSELLTKLAHVHHHHSILEHSSISYLIEGISRGVLQEHARHRIQSISVKSTRYTMSSVIHAFIASSRNHYWFNRKIKELDLFVVSEENYIDIEITNIFNKLKHQQNLLGDEFIELSLSKSNIEVLEKFNSDPSDYEDNLYSLLENGKAKRNVGDPFKHIVTDNWKTDMVVTFNIRSLKNYLKLRNSGSAWFQIQWLAEEMEKVTPESFLKMIYKQ